MEAPAPQHPQHASSVPARPPACLPASACLPQSACLQVYDVTSYIEHHPGGDAILWHAGGDATSGFLGIQHPPTVFELVEEYCIGWLED